MNYFLLASLSVVAIGCQTPEKETPNVLTIDKDAQTLEKQLTKTQRKTQFEEGSGIEITGLTTETISNLELLGRVWGFLKYHHPEIAQGNRNWDYELFRFLPRYHEAETIEERDQHLISWIDALGKVEKCNSCQSTNKTPFLKPDHKWIENQRKGIRGKLYSIYDRRFQGKQFYIQKVPGIGNPEFLNEKPYSSMSYPDDGFRILSLFRYWNMIHYFFPSKYLINTDWNAVLRKYIPVFLAASNELEYELAAVQLIGEIQDTHANLWSGADKIDEWKGTNYPPIHVRFIEDKLIVTDYYNFELKPEVQLAIGDEITKINDTTIDDLVKEKSRYYPASNRSAQLRDLSADLLRSRDSKIKIHYKTSGNLERIKTLKLYPKDSLDIYFRYRRNKDKSFKLLENNIGYVTLQTIKESDVSEIRQEFKNTNGIIIDIRNYPSHVVVFSLGSFFTSSPTPFVKFTTGNINNPGEFTFTEPLELSNGGKAYKGKLVVLVNELTQSQAEYTTMAFRVGKNTTVIGSQTAGADGNVSTIFLPGGLRTWISGVGVYYPNGVETQRIGIVPDKTVKPTINGIRQGKD